MSTLQDRRSRKKISLRKFESVRNISYASLKASYDKCMPRSLSV